MYCNKCLSKNTRITCTQHKGKITVRYQRCLDCKNKFITNEVHVKKQKTPFSSKGYKLNEEKVRIIRKTVIKDSDTIFNMATDI